jgi:hypothetical protein
MTVVCWLQLADKIGVSPFCRQQGEAGGRSVTCVDLSSVMMIGDVGRFLNQWQQYVTY